MPRAHPLQHLATIIVVAGCLALSSPLNPYKGYLVLWDSFKHPLVAVAMLVIASVALGLRVRRVSTLNSGVALFAAMALILMALAWSLGGATHTFAFTWLLFALALHIPRENHPFLVGLLSLTLSAYLLTGLWLFAFRVGQFETPGFGLRFSGVFASPNTAYPLALLSVSVALAALRKAATPLTRTFFITLALLGGVSTALTFSRAAILGLATLLLGGCLSLPTRMRLRIAIPVVVAAAVLLTVRTGGQLPLPDRDRSVSGRVLIYEGAMKRIAMRPWIGEGPDEMIHRFWNRDPTNTDGRSPTMEAKNLFLDTALRYGIPGSIFLTTLLVWSAFAWGKGDAMGQANSLASAAFLVAGWFDTPIFGSFERFPGTCLAMSLLGGALGATLDPAPGVSEDPVSTG